MGEVLFQYGISLLELNVGMYACFDVKIKYPWRQIAGALLCLVLVEILKPTGFPVSVTASITAMIVMILCMGKQWKKSFFRVVILAVLISGLCEMWDIPRILYQAMNGLKEEATLATIGINAVLCCLILGVVGFIRRKISEGVREKFFRGIQKNIPMMTVVVICNIFLVISFLGVVIGYEESKTMIGFLGMLEFISFFNILVFSCYIWYVWEMNRRVVLVNRRMESYRKAEKLHYETLLKSEKATRKYRHDMANHLICMEQLAQREAWEALKSYLSGMTGQIKSLPTPYETGNRILDILTNCLLSEEYINADIRIYGGVASIGKIHQEELCAIYANLLQNAIEELRRNQNGEKGFLCIRFSGNERFLQIEMENSLSAPKQDLRSKKKDREQHGFGIENVREAIEKNGGELEVEIREKSFYAGVILPLDGHSAD